MSTLVLGAGGFVAKYLVPELIRSQRFGNVIAVSRTAPVISGAAGLACNLTDVRAVRSLLEQYQPEHIFHLAGSSRVSESIPFSEYHANNLVTTECLCEALLATQKKLSVFFASSVHVYGNQRAPVEESCPAEPVTAYGFTKYLAEQRLFKTVQECPGLRVVVGRLYSCTGPGQAEGYVVTDLARKIWKVKSGQTKTIQVGSLSGKRSFLDIRDLPAILMSLIQLKSDARYSVFNIAPKVSHKIEEILDLLLRHAQVNPKIESNPALSANPLKDLDVRVDKLAKALPDLKLRPLSQTLADLFDSLDG